MKIYNTLKRKKENFEPSNPPKVTFYTCGPTVYDYFHIGNARSFIMADITRRYLIYKGYDVKFVMNITDIDDKLIKKANEQGRTFSEVAAEYTKAFLDDIEKLKIKKADVYPKATEHMEEIRSLIEKLESRERAYNVSGDVFYDVKKFEGYGKLSGKNTDDLEVGARIELNESKRNPLDFTLWKKAKENEPAWESKWGSGRPGWHIECSAMSTKHLGDTIDIHAGGNDLIFPHHENEIAQTEGATGKPFVKYWMHFGFLNIQNEKMSKSLGNFFTAREILKKYRAESIRLLFSQSHYSGPLNFSEELLESAEKGLQKIRNFVENINEGLAGNIPGEYTKFDFTQYYQQFEEVMDDDFDTPRAAAIMFDFVRDVNKHIVENDNLPAAFYQQAKIFMEKTAGEVLGIVSFDESKDNSNNSLEKELIELLIRLRQEAKNDKNYQLADKIRDELKSLGIVLKDSKTGTTYKKE